MRKYILYLFVLALSTQCRPKPSVPYVEDPEVVEQRRKLVDIIQNAISTGNAPKVKKYVLLLQEHSGTAIINDILIYTAPSQTILMYAAGSGKRRATVDTLLNIRGIDINKAQKYYHPRDAALHFAVSNSHRSAATEITRALIEDPRTDPNIQNSYHGQTPLHYAAKKNHRGPVQILLTHPDIDPNIIDQSGFTPLHLAARNGYTGVVKDLLAHPGINPNRGLTTALYLAADKGHTEVVHVLLAHPDIDPNTAAYNGSTALHLAAGRGSVSIVDTLLTHNDTDPNIQDNNGNTPLHFAAGRFNISNKQVEIIQALLAHASIKVNLCNTHNKTPLKYARDEHGNEPSSAAAAAIEALIAAGGTETCDSSE